MVRRLLCGGLGRGWVRADAEGWDTHTHKHPIHTSPQRETTRLELGEELVEEDELARVLHQELRVALVDLALGGRVVPDLWWLRVLDWLVRRRG